MCSTHAVHKILILILICIFIKRCGTRHEMNASFTTETILIAGGFDIKFTQGDVFQRLQRKFHPNNTECVKLRLKFSLQRFLLVIYYVLSVRNLRHHHSFLCFFKLRNYATVKMKRFVVPL